MIGVAAIGHVFEIATYSFTACVPGMKVLAPAPVQGASLHCLYTLAK